MFRAKRFSRNRPQLKQPRRPLRQQTPPPLPNKQYNRPSRPRNEFGNLQRSRLGRTIMNHRNAIRILATAATILCATALMAITVVAQDQNEQKKPAASEKSRDPFKQYEPVRKIKPAPVKLEPPTIQMRIERYRAQKLAAAAAHVAPPKPPTALMLNEIQVNGIFRTPRGWAAMVEATPIKLSYV